MKALSSIRAFGSRLVAAVLIGTAILVNRYEAGVRWSPHRSWLPGYVQDARFDADQMTRWEIVRKSRYFERNSALLNRLADLFEQFVVGAGGLQLMPASSDEEWNGRAKTWWDEWCKFCDLTSLQSFGTIQSLIARSWFIDGEIFILKTRGSEAPRRPRIQLIESHRVCTPPNLATEEGRTMIDGVEIDSRGRPIAYWVRDGLLDETFRRVPADQMVHHFEPSRPGQYRGLPFLHAVLNDLHDLDDLQILEMAAAKDGAEKSTFFKTATGEQNAESMRRERWGQPTQTSTGADVLENRTKYVRDVIGGRTVGMKIGEDVQQFLPNRPTGATQALWNILCGKVCMGTGISKLLVMPESIQGTVARGELALANAFFRSRSMCLADSLREIRNYVIGWGVLNDVEIADPPADWRNVTVRAPRAVDVDVGRNANAVVAGLAAGTTTYQDVYGELGQDWRPQLRQRAIEAKYIRDLAKEFQVEPGEIASLAGEAIAKALQAEAAANPPDQQTQQQAA